MAKEGIGKEFTGITVTFQCHDGRGRYLLTKRSKNARDEHERWEQGGGGLKFGERADDAIRREVREEFCTTVRSFKFVGYRDILREHEGAPTHWVGLDFFVEVDPEPVAIGEPHKCDELRWVTRDELFSFTEPYHSQFPVFIEKYRQHYL